jgi:hypothetical protein
MARAHTPTSLRQCMLCMKDEIDRLGATLARAALDTLVVRNAVDDAQPGAEAAEAAADPARVEAAVAEGRGERRRGVDRGGERERGEEGGELHDGLGEGGLSGVGGSVR